jgi:signal transduction histidine kinase
MEGCLGHLERISAMLGVKFGTDPQAADMGRSIRKEVGRLRAMSQRLHLYAELPNLYSRRFSDVPQSPSFSSCQAALETAQTVAGQWSRTQDLSVHLPPSQFLAPLPTDALTVLTRELVDNACKFSPPATPVVLEVESAPGYWKLAVSDNGSGIPPQQVKQIGAFRQHWSGSERPPGLGLGLVLVQSLARLHSGETMIETHRPAGTRVSILIPVDEK